MTAPARNRPRTSTAAAVVAVVALVGPLTLKLSVPGTYLLRRLDIAERNIAQRFLSGPGALDFSYSPEVCAVDVCLCLFVCLFDPAHSILSDTALCWHT